MNLSRSAAASLALILAASTAAFAAPVTYVPNANHTFVRFSYDHFGFTTQESRFNKTTGSVTFDAPSPILSP